MAAAGHKPGPTSEVGEKTHLLMRATKWTCKTHERKQKWKFEVGYHRLFDTMVQKRTHIKRFSNHEYAFSHSLKAGKTIN